MILKLQCPVCGQIEEKEWDGCSSLKLSNLRICKCGTRMNIMNESTPATTAETLKSINSSKIASMTPQERKALLKQRSNRDFKKNIEAKKRDMDKNVIPR